MKDREYYERLISDSLDRQLSPQEQEDLHRGMTQYPELLKFEQDLHAQTELVRKLPQQHTDAPLAIPERKRGKQGLLRAAWNIRISVPLPVAAVLALLVTGSLLIGVFSGQPPQVHETRPATKPVEYVQIERLKPAKAVLIEPRRNDQSPEKEAL